MHPPRGPEVMEIVNEKNLPDAPPADRGRKCWARLRKVKGSAPFAGRIKRPPQLTASFISDEGIPDGVATTSSNSFLTSKSLRDFIFIGELVRRRFSHFQHPPRCWPLSIPG